MRVKPQCCRNCEHFVPRAGMCVHPISAINRDMPLRRYATDGCKNHAQWRASDDGAIAGFQLEDRMAAFPQPVIQGG